MSIEALAIIEGATFLPTSDTSILSITLSKCSPCIDSDDKSTGLHDKLISVIDESTNIFDCVQDLFCSLTDICLTAIGEAW